ncbi:MAG: SixA phosphatase family protein [Planctomycetota bacterium]
MELLIVRHGRAVDTGTEGVSRDADRFLSPEGKHEAQVLGRALSTLNALPERAFSSPLTRAEETAATVLKAAGCEAPIELSPGLKPGATPLGIAGLVTSRASGLGRIMIVGHQPDLGRLIGSLTGEEAVDLKFSAGSLARVDVSNPGKGWKGCLVWLLPPSALTRLAGED